MGDLVGVAVEGELVECRVLDEVAGNDAGSAPDNPVVEEMRERINLARFLSNIFEILRYPNLLKYRGIYFQKRLYPPPPRKKK